MNSLVLPGTPMIFCPFSGNLPSKMFAVQEWNKQLLSNLWIKKTVVQLVMLLGRSTGGTGAADLVLLDNRLSCLSVKLEV